MSSAPISLYLELEDGQIADLEVVAKASLAFVSAIKEIAFQVDPLLVVRVEIDSGTKGSLSINARIKTLKDKYLTRRNIVTVAAVVLVYFKDEVQEHVVGEILDEYIPSISEDRFSDAQRQELKDIVDGALERRIGKKEIGKVYQELEEDPAVKGVGATASPSKKPDSIVPREEFRYRSGESRVIETEVRKRTTEPRLTVTLVKPALEHRKRSWRLKSANGEFGAMMQDEDFLDGLLAERIQVPMIEGVQLDVTLKVEEELTPDGVWEIKSRKIVKVHGYSRPPSQTSLLPSPQLRPSVHDNEDDDD